MSDVDVLKEMAGKDTVLYVATVGSTAFGFSNRDSDKDVVCVTAKRLADYLSVASAHEKTRHVSWDGVDYSCYDLKKFLFSLYQSNPTVLEAVHVAPEHVQHGHDFRQDMVKLASKYFDPRKMLHSYFGHAVSRGAKFLEYFYGNPNEHEMGLKHWLHMVRLYLNAVYVYKHESMPLVTMLDLVYALLPSGIFGECFGKSGVDRLVSVVVNRPTQNEHYKLNDWHIDARRCLDAVARGYDIPKRKMPGPELVDAVFAELVIQPVIDSFALPLG